MIKPRLPSSPESKNGTTRHARWVGLGATAALADALVAFESVMQDHRPQLLIWRGRFPNPFESRHSAELDPHTIRAEDLSVLFHPQLMDDPSATQIRWLLPHVAGRALLGQTPPWPEDFFFALRDNWLVWPDAEQGAIRAFLRAAWTWLLEGEGTGVFDGWSMMSALAYIGDDLRSYLEAWLMNPSPEAAGNLTFWSLEFRDRLGCAEFQSSLIPHTQHRLYRDWLRHAPLQAFVAANLRMEDPQERKDTLQSFDERLAVLRRKVGEDG